MPQLVFISILSAGA